MQEQALLLCGYSYTKRVYRHLIDTAPSNWTLHSLLFQDILKHGATETFHEVIKKYLSEQKLDKVRLIAHSLGGAYAIDFAYYYPALVKNLYLLNTIGIHNPMSFPALLKNVVLSKRYHFRKGMHRHVYGLTNIITKPGDHLRLLQYARKINLEEKAKHIAVPTNIIWGDKDPLLPVANAEKMQKLIRNSKFIILKGQDHDWPIHSPELFWKNI